MKNNFSRFGLLSENICFVKGDILETLDKETIPDRISVLRLDTDWYESTKKEMEVLYKKIVHNGVFMMDDYGHWAGSKKAVDEYLKRLRNAHFYNILIIWKAGNKNSINIKNA